MAQLTLEIDEETVSLLEAAANAAGESLASWIVEILERHIRQQWPPTVACLAGAWRDLPEAEVLRASGGEDIREPLDIDR